VNCLPNEVVLQIFWWLDPLSLSRSSQVCIQWKEVAQDDILWRRFCENSTVERLQSEDNIIWKEVVTGNKMNFAARKPNFKRILRTNSIILLIFLLSVFLLGVALIQKQQYKLDTYIPTTGIIVHSEVKIRQVLDDDDGDDSFDYSADILYQYNCKYSNRSNLVVESSKLFPITISFRKGEEFSSETVAHFPKGEIVKVFVDPNDCGADSFLIRMTDFNLYYVILIPLFVTAIFSYFLLFGMSRSMVLPSTPYRVFQSDFQLWLCEYLPTENNKISIDQMWKIYFLIWISYQLLGTLGICHYWIWGKDVEFPVITTVLFVGIGLFPFYQYLRYFIFSYILTDIQIFQKDPYFVLGTPIKLYVKATTFRRIFVKNFQLEISCFKIQNRLNVDEEKMETHKIFSKRYLLMENIWVHGKVLTDKMISIDSRLHASNALENSPHYSWFLKVEVSVKNLPAFRKEIPICVKKSRKLVE